MSLPCHMFCSDSDGALYDTRQADWHKAPPLRPIYSRHFSEIKNAQQFKACLREGAFAWPGGYPLFFICDDGGALSFTSARENLREILGAFRSGERNGWRVVACETNWEDPDLYCAHSGERIPWAYGEDENEGE